MPSLSSGLRSPFLDLSTNLFETEGALGLCRTNTFVDSREQLVGFFHILSNKPLSKSCSVFRCQFFDRFLNFSQTTHVKDQLPKTLTLRILRYEITVPGFGSKEVILVTTLLDPKLYPAQELEKLYFRRWNVGLHFRQIKTMLGMDVLRCLTPRMVLKELAMHRIAYNLIRALMQRAALTYDVTKPRKEMRTAPHRNRPKNQS